ncbi:aldo/keto reductase [Micromonospora sp. NPDC048063]|uniref:aldo/keto reductase n=1 Tax=Micromonospora sp. NPDC048063 TaxID=3364256 RepID=UPI00371622F4
MSAAELPARTLTRLGRTVPALAAGCWPLAGPCVNGGADVGWAPINDATALHALRAAWATGLRLFDTADIYGHGLGEQRVGQLLAEVPREQMLVITKTGYDRQGGHPYQALQMTRRLGRSLARLGTDYLDIYAFHSGDFGTDDQHLAEAVAQIREFKREGMIRAIAMRAPHEFAAEWATEDTPRGQRAKRFLHLFDQIQPDIVSVRHNLLSPAYGPNETTVLDLARRRGVDVLLKQVLGQGLLVHHDPPPVFAVGDHRRRHAWFSPLGRRLIWDGLHPVRDRYGQTPADLVRVAIQYALATAPASVALVGFRTAAQITATAHISSPLTPEEVADLAAIGARIRATLDEVFRVPQPALNSIGRLT